MDGLLEWYDEHRRDLPWRVRRDPWRVWVSEVMLQQTPAARVAGVYEPFMERFPTVASMAGSPLADVLAAWGTLGYPRRARDLWRASLTVMADLDGVIPSDPDELRRLPGIGEYTSHAIAAFGFGRDDARPADTNVVRVMRRFSFSPDDEPTRAQVVALLEGVPEPPRGFEALMDIGATLCRARACRCGACPLVGACASAFAAVPPNAPGVRRQPPFKGSRRESRGRVMAALREGPSDISAFPADVVTELAGEGLVEVVGRRARLARA